MLEIILNGKNTTALQTVINYITFTKSAIKMFGGHQTVQHSDSITVHESKLMLIFK